MQASKSAFSLVAIVVLTGCESKATSTQDASGTQKASGTREPAGGCKPLAGAERTMADIERTVETKNKDSHEGGLKLTKGTCGALETADATNGFVHWGWYLKGGAVVGKTYSDDNQGHWCQGSVPDNCKGE